MTDTDSAPTTRQTAKAQARNSAKAAPPADPDVAAQALADAEASTPTGKPRQQPVYKTQTDAIAGENVHRPKDAVISEFDDPASNTVRADRSADPAD